MAYVHGGRLVAQALKRHGTTHLFTLCGGHIQAIYDGCLDEEIRVVDVRHEQTAGHAADGYARVTGRPGVCAVTAGPGVTDVVTAVANAHRAGIPMVVIGGAGPKLLSDMGSLQDMDHVTLMRPITKWSVQVPETRRIVEYIDAAFRIAQANVPGPVFLEIPLDILMNMHEDADAPATRPVLAYAGAGRRASRPAGNPRAIASAAELLQAAARPCFLVGSQIRWSPARTAVKRAADAFQVPFYLNGMARVAHCRSSIQGSSRGRESSRLPPRPTSSSSLARPLRLPRRLRARADSWAENAKIVQVDLDAAELGKNRRVDVAVDGDSGLVLEQPGSRRPARRRFPEWLGAVRADETKRRAKMRSEIESNESPPNPLRVCAEIGKRLGKNDIVIERTAGDFRRDGRLRAQARVAAIGGWIQGRSERSASAPGMRWPPSSCVQMRA